MEWNEWKKAQQKWDVPVDGFVEWQCKNRVVERFSFFISFCALRRYIIADMAFGSIFFFQSLCVGPFFLFTKHHTFNCYQFMRKMCFTCARLGETSIAFWLDILIMHSSISRRTKNRTESRTTNGENDIFQKFIGEKFIIFRSSSHIFLCFFHMRKLLRRKVKKWTFFFCHSFSSSSFV